MPGRDFPPSDRGRAWPGLPIGRDEAALKGWRQAMAAFSVCPNSVVKVSGPGEPGQAWTSERNGPVVRFIVDTFGADRAMFASNFPVDSLCATFGEIVHGMKSVMASYPRPAQAAFFSATARRVYRLGTA